MAATAKFSGSSELAPRFLARPCYAPGEDICLRQYRRFLQNVGCARSHTTGSHEHWTRAGLLRSSTVQPRLERVRHW